jgi:hypothetical protein
MTLLLDPPTATAAATVVETPPAVDTTPLVVYGDFSCPWSYLAFRRTRVLADHGIDVDWRAVEHDPRRPGRARRLPARVTDLQQELDRVLAMLLPGEQLPYDLAGFVPTTAAAVTAYAEGRVSGVGPRLASVIFESFWMHGIDIGDPAVLRTVLVDQLRGSASPAEAVREWGYPCDVTGGPISTAAWRLAVGWSAEWHAAERGVVPMVARSDGATIHGVEAVRWLGEVVASLTDAPTPAPLVALPRPTEADRREVPDLGWVTAVGMPWHERFRRAAS